MFWNPQLEEIEKLKERCFNPYSNGSSFFMRKQTILY